MVVVANRFRRGIRMLAGLAVGGSLLVAGCSSQIQFADPLAGQPTPVARPAVKPHGPVAPTPTPSTAPSTPTPRPSESTPAPTPTPTPTKAPKPTEAPKPKAILAAGASGDQVRELQARLKQLDWFAEKVTGTYGPVTTAGVKGFQGKRELRVTGEVDQKTWDALLDRTRQPTKAELADKPAKPAILSRGDAGDKVKELQARLKQLDWFDVAITGTYGPVTEAGVEGFQEKRKLDVTGAVDQKTWDTLLGLTREPTRAELADAVPTASTKGLDERCLTGRAICISKRTNHLVWLIDGKPKLEMDVRFGSDELPTREGTFSVLRKKKDVISNLYHTKMPYSMFFSGGQAVHYSADFAARGYNGASHGCVNVRNWDGIVALYAQARVGDKVIVYS
ncbi:peptidoglycan-binding protein [Microlunatus sp. GCM10028923]|uniref:L,D-transpeptidase family protein n=1 Tax=Microlunatus sp. GCM10028923 TaxID=3273400 RepID=UPI003611BC44